LTIQLAKDITEKPVALVMSKMAIRALKTNPIAISITAGSKNPTKHQHRTNDKNSKQRQY